MNELWLEVVGAIYRMVDRLTRILYRNRLFNYPLKPLDGGGGFNKAPAAPIDKNSNAAILVGQRQFGS